MSGHLKDKVIIVTGAGNGFGQLISEKCAAGGAKIVGLDVNADNLKTVFDGISAGGGQGVGVVADVTDLAQMRDAARRALETYGAIDVLVNNAGIMPLAFFADHEAAAAAWDKVIDINFKGAVHGIAAVYDQMMAQGRGQVVNISSIYGNAGVEGSGVYSATKAAVAVLSDSLRVETKGKIKVTTVKPTGILGTGLMAGIVNEAAAFGLTGQRASQFAEHWGAAAQGQLPEALADVDSVQYWMITPGELADAVVHVIDQPWGISISDITVRASGEDFVY